MIDSRGKEKELIVQLAEFWRHAKQPEIGQAIQLLRHQFYSRRCFIDRMTELSEQAIGADESLVYRWEKRYNLAKFLLPTCT